MFVIGNNDELVVPKVPLAPIDESGNDSLEVDQLKVPQEETYDKGYNGSFYLQSQMLGGQVDAKNDNIQQPKNDETQPYHRENALQHKMKTQTMAKDKGLEETQQKLQHFEKQLSHKLQIFEQQVIQKLQNLENKLNKVTEWHYAYSLCEMKRLQQEHNAKMQNSEYIAHLKGEVDWLREKVDETPHGIACVIV